MIREWIAKIIFDNCYAHVFGEFETTDNLVLKSYCYEVADTIVKVLDSKRSENR